MHIQEQQRLLRQLLDGAKNDTSADAGGVMRAPVTDFICPDLLVQEQNVFFRETPLLLGLSSDLPEPNTYLATSEVGVPLLLTRDSDGAFAAFLNVCRHRGVQVVPDGRGERDRFTCPFHAWTYKNSGDLIAINREEKFGCIDKDAYGLAQVPAVEAHGMLWVRPQPAGDGFNVTDVLGGLADEFDSWNFPSHANLESQVLHANINWKLAIDTFGENYHFNVLHRDSLATEIIGNLQTHDIFGNNYRMVFASKPGFERVEAAGVPIEQWPYRRVTIGIYFIYPNVIMIIDVSGVDVLRMYPDANDPSKSRTHHSRYRDPRFLELAAAEGFDVPDDQFEGFNRIIVDEDYATAESIQANADSGAQTHYIFGHNEPALHHYHNVRRQGLGRELLPLESDA